MNNRIKQIIEQKIKSITHRFQVIGLKPDGEKLKKNIDTWENVKKFAINSHKKYKSKLLVVILFVNNRPKDSLIYRYDEEKNVWNTNGFKKEEVEIDEIVDEDGNIGHGTKPGDIMTKGITSKSTTDKVVKSGTGQMGNTFGFGFAGGRSGSAKTIRYWAESDMSKVLGHQVLDDNLPKDEAEEYFEDELGIDDAEAKERLEKMGYDDKLPDDKLRLVEDPKQFVKDYLENILPKRTKVKDVIEKEGEDISPIIRRQINVLKQTLKNNNVSTDVLIQYLKGDE